MFQPGRTAIHVLRDGSPQWSGIIWTRRITKDGLTFGAEGWHSGLRKRTINWDLDYDQDQLAIFRDLIDRTQSQSNGDFGIELGAETSGVDRVRTYRSHERKFIGEALEQLAAVENGFDFEIVPYLNGREVRRKLALYYPRKGRRRNDLRFTHGSNIVILEEETDGKALANTIHAVGAGEGDTMLRTTVAAPESLTTFPLYEDVLTHKSVKEEPTLVANAQDLLAGTRYPVDVVSATVETTPGTFSTGDEIRVSADDGPREIDQWFRVVGLGVDVSDEGDEKITTDFAPVEAFS